MTTSIQTAPILYVRDLHVVATDAGDSIVQGVDLQIAAGEVVGLVGESGSGKTTIGLACMGYARRGTRIVGGTVMLGAETSMSWSAHDLTTLRRHVVAYVPQAAGFALDPSARIGVQLGERLKDSARNDERLLDALDEVALPREREFLRRYPHELSGGQQQRLLIASAFIAEPRVVILDEPTTGLDVTTQATILAMVRRICRDHGTAAMFISHNLGAVAALCSRMIVLYAGQIAETGPTRELLRHPSHPYTYGLLQAVPKLRGRQMLFGIEGRAPNPSIRAEGCTFAPRCRFVVPQRCRDHEPPLVGEAAGRQVRCFFPLDEDHSTPAIEHTEERSVPMEDRPPGAGLLEVANLCANYGANEVLHHVTIALPPATCTAIVGESGSGKTTLSCSIIGLHSAYTGNICLDGSQLDPRARRRTPTQRRLIQYIFQNPYDAMNPRRRVRDLIRQPLEVFGERPARSFVAEQLELVSLPASMADRYPEELSGGERQRIALARALAVRPRVLICDEITSALDVSVQATMVRLLARLQQEMNLTVLFVTHDIALVRQIAQRVVVLKDGQVVEQSETTMLFTSPAHAYTRALLENTPDLGEMTDRWTKGTERGRKPSGSSVA